MPPVNLADTSYAYYGRLNAPLQATVGSYLTGSSGFEYHCYFSNTSGSYYWWGSSPSLYWSAVTPSLSWTASGLGVGAGLPLSAGLTQISNGAAFNAGTYNGSGWNGNINWSQQVEVQANIVDSCSVSDQVGMWIGGNPYGVGAASTDSFGPVF